MKKTRLSSPETFLGDCRLEDAREDLLFLDSLPGKKLIGKGNHDFWWCTQKKLLEFLDQHNIKSIKFLYNCAYEVEDYIICGTRGWFYDDSVSGIPQGTDFDKLVNREAQRLKISLTQATELSAQTNKPILCFLHFPPVWNGTACEPFVDLLVEFGVKKCYFGHIHGAYNVAPYTEYRGINFTNIAADFLNFVPRIIFPPDLD